MTNMLKNKLKCVIKAIDSKKGAEIKIIDMSSISCFFDYFIFCSANNERLLKAISEEVENSLSLAGYDCKLSGDEKSGWIICDAKDIIIHVFDHQTRSYYNIDRLYDDLKQEDHEVYLDDK